MIFGLSVNKYKNNLNKVVLFKIKDEIIISTDKSDRIKEIIEKTGVYYGVDNGLNPLHNHK